MKKYQSIGNHDDLLNVVDDVLGEAGLERKELGGKMTFAGMDPIRPTGLKVGSAAAAITGANAVASSPTAPTLNQDVPESVEYCQLP